MYSCVMSSCRKASVSAFLKSSHSDLLCLGLVSFPQNQHACFQKFSSFQGTRMLLAGAWESMSTPFCSRQMATARQCASSAASPSLKPCGSTHVAARMRRSVSGTVAVSSGVAEIMSGVSSATTGAGSGSSAGVHQPPFQLAIPATTAAAKVAFACSSSQIRHCSNVQWVPVHTAISGASTSGTAAAKRAASCSAFHVSHSSRLHLPSHVMATVDGTRRLSPGKRAELEPGKTQTEYTKKNPDTPKLNIVSHPSKQGEKQAHETSDTGRRTARKGPVRTPVTKLI